jgi:hypothetical protein
LRDGFVTVGQGAEVKGQEAAQVVEVVREERFFGAGDGKEGVARQLDALCGAGVGVSAKVNEEQKRREGGGNWERRCV